MGMSEKNDERTDEQQEDLLGSVANASISRRTLLRRTAVGGAALGVSSMLAGCFGGGDDEEAAGTTTAAANTSAGGKRYTFYSVTHGESGHAFLAIYRIGARIGSNLY